MKMFVIMRGLSGSGKSKLSKQLVKQAFTEDFVTSGIIINTDSFFMVEGEYKFDYKLLPLYHELAFNGAVEAFKLGINLVVLDNTNIKTSHFRHYEKVARVFGYRICKIIVGSFDSESVHDYYDRSQHNVPIEVIERNAAEFETDEIDSIYYDFRDPQFLTKVLNHELA